MDENYLDPDKNSLEPKKDSPHDEIPLWLQGLAKRADNDITDKHHTDEWIKETSPAEPSDQNVNNPVQDENKQEEILPDWISELPVEDSETITFENTIPNNEKSDDIDDLPSDRTIDDTDHQDFLEISDLSSTIDQNTEPSWSKEIQNEEELPDWLKEMINERGENLSDDTEPVFIQNDQFAAQEDESSAEEEIGEEEDFRYSDQDDTSPFTPEALIEDQDKIELQSEKYDANAEKEDTYEDQKDLVDEEIVDDQIHDLSHEPLQDVTEEEPFEDFKEISGDLDDTDLEYIQSETINHDALELIKEEEEEESIEVFTEFPMEKTPIHEIDELPIEELHPPSNDDLGIPDEDLIEKVDELPEWGMEDDLYDINLVEEIDHRELEEPISADENVEEDDETSFNRWLSEITSAEKTEETTQNIEDHPQFLETAKSNVNEDLTVGDEVPEYLQTIETKPEFIIDQDTSPTPVINLEDDLDLLSKDDDEVRYIPKVLEKAKQHLEQGDMKKGLDIIDVYIDEDSYLDEILTWLENLAKHPGNLNHRLLTSLGDLALKQGQPETAYENYTKAMQYLIHK